MTTTKATTRTTQSPPRTESSVTSRRHSSNDATTLPIFRSVSSSTRSSTLSSASSTTTTTTTTRRVSTATFPSLIVTRKQRQGQHQQQQSQPTTTTNDNNINTTTEFSSTTVPWKLQRLDAIPFLPEIYPTVRNVLTLSNNEDNGIAIHVLSERIVTFMRLNSIKCTYQDHRVICSTPTVPKFVVLLWRTAPSGDSINSSSNDQIILEVQRRQGCVVAMNYIRKALFRSIKTGNTAQLLSHHQPPAMMCPVERAAAVAATRRKVPACIIRQKQRQQQQKNEEKAIGHALEVCLSLLESTGHTDQRRLGMESLGLFLTDTNKTQDARVVAEALICRKGMYGERLQNAFEDFVHDMQQQQNELVGEGHVDSHLKFALQALANSLDLLLVKDVTNNNNNNNSIYLDELVHPSDAVKCFWCNMLQVVVRSLQLAEDCPASAVMAARIVQSLETSCAGTNNDIRPFAQYPQSLPRLAFHAYKYGQAHHVCLEEAAQQLLIQE